MPLTRRAFAATALSASRILGANDRLRVAGLGVGGRGRALLERVARIEGTAIAALADVYEPRFASFPQAKSHADYRAALDDKSIDAVVIASPDHWHVRMTLDAIAAGKDVYVEKPLTKTIEEGYRIERAFRESDRIVQVGYQQRSTDTFLRAKELVDAGEVGEITLARTWWYQNYHARRGKLPVIDASKLDWKAWLGPAPAQPFDALRYIQWRWFWDFGGGTLTDLFSHWADSVHWILGKSRPELVAAAGRKVLMTEWECPDSVAGSWSYPGFVVSYDSTLVSSIEDGGLVLRGTKGALRVTRSAVTLYPEDAAQGGALPPPKFEFRAQSDGTLAHLQNWIDCVRSRKTPNSDIPAAVASANAAHLGNRSLREESVVKLHA
jgi:predicted dehydrogenase